MKPLTANEVYCIKQNGKLLYKVIASDLATTTTTDGSIKILLLWAAPSNDSPAAVIYDTGDLEIAPGPDTSPRPNRPVPADCTYLVHNPNVATVPVLANEVDAVTTAGTVAFYKGRNNLVSTTPFHAGTFILRKDCLKYPAPQ